MPGPAARPQQCLNFRPLPHGHWAFRRTRSEDMVAAVRGTVPTRGPGCAFSPRRGPGQAETASSCGMLGRPADQTGAGRPGRRVGGWGRACLDSVCTRDGRRMADAPPDPTPPPLPLAAVSAPRATRDLVCVRFDVLDARATGAVRSRSGDGQEKTVGLGRMDTR